MRVNDECRADEIESCVCIIISLLGSDERVDEVSYVKCTSK